MYGCQQGISLESKITLQTLCIGWNMETQNKNFPRNIPNKAKEYFSVSEIDLFASCFTIQLFKYVSWSPDPSVFVISILRHILKFYYFPFFSLIGASVSKIRNEKTSGIIPYWVVPVWFPVMFCSAAGPSHTPISGYFDFTVQQKAFQFSILQDEATTQCIPSLPCKTTFNCQATLF